MGVAGKLEAQAGLRCDQRLVRRMSQQNAGASGVNSDFRKNRTEMLWMRSVMIGHAYDLQTFHIDFFILQIADSNLSNCIQVLRFAPEELVIPSYEESSKRRTQESKRCHHFGRVYMSSVKQIAGEKNDVGV